MGGVNSGSNLHIDPLGSSAWNTLLLGRKLWALFPPGTHEGSLKSAETMGISRGGCGSRDRRPVDFCAAGWFAHMLPSLPSEVNEEKLLFVQEEGETVFVPAGWSHAVLNLTTTVCVTQNYASPYDYQVLHFLLFFMLSCPSTCLEPFSTMITCACYSLHDMYEYGMYMHEPLTMRCDKVVFIQILVINHHVPPWYDS
jgi:hypothetical protein